MKALWATLLLEKFFISTRNKSTIPSHHFSEGSTLLTRFVLQQNKWVDFFKGLIIKNLLDIS